MCWSFTKISLLINLLYPSPITPANDSMLEMNDFEIEGVVLYRSCKQITKKSIGLFIIVCKSVP